MSYTLTISVGLSGLIDRIRRNLSVIGKKVRDKDGDAIYSDVTTTASEEVLFGDFLLFGAESVVSELSDVSSSYAESNGDTVTFKITSTRWHDTATAEDLSPALKGSIENYLYNFCLGRYLSAISPIGKSSFGEVYGEHCKLLIRNIKTLAFLKREVAETSGKGYGDVKMEKNKEI